MNLSEGYSIAIPAYGRTIEFEELLTSISNLNLTPNEVIICEDGSKQRPVLKEIAEKWKLIFEDKNCKFSFIENKINLGYDANIRKLIELASFKWVVLIGNDDLFLPNGLNLITEFCSKHPNLGMVSRPFLRFYDDVNKPVGVSRFLSNETVVIYNRLPANYIFRICGFFGGLVVNKNWAAKYHTDVYDGTLFYQIYLACHAYCTNGIGYLSEPPVAARNGNIPLFGEAGAEDHIPGAYSAKARARMWKGVLDIANDVGRNYNIDLYNAIKRELTVQQSFHIFEMNAGASKKTLIDLKNELNKIGLFNHLVPKFLFYLNYTLGSKSIFFYYLVRKIYQ